MVVTKRKLFYPIDEACQRLGATLLDVSVLVAERQLRLSVAVAGLLVEFGTWEEAEGSGPCRVPHDTRRLTGLVDLRAEDAWWILRHGSQTVFWLDGEPGTYLQVMPQAEEDRGYTVTRDEVGIRHAEMIRYEAAQGIAVPEAEAPAGRPRGAQAKHDWKACWVEICRTVYFDGVPESQAALIRHLQAWFAAQGRPVPDESTLKRELKLFWPIFAPEARRKTA